MKIFCQCSSQFSSKCPSQCLSSPYLFLLIGFHKFRSIFVTTPTATQENLNTVVGLDMKMTVQAPPPQKLNKGLKEPQINIY